MKEAMSGFDLFAMANELNKCTNAYVKKAYMPHYEQIVLRINPKEMDQFDLVFVRGSRIYTSNRDRPMPMTPPPFAMLLRKHLKNSRFTGVRQLGFDRVLSFDFETKFGTRHIYVEVFRDGNIILVDQEGIIIQPLTHAAYAGRTLKKGFEYTPPPAAINPFSLDEQGLTELFKDTDRDLVSTLGGKLNLGGTHANAICQLAGHQPNMEAEDADIGKVHSALHELLNDLSNSNSGFLILKPSDEVPVEELQAVADKQIMGVIRDRFLELHAEEATPILLPSHADRVSVRFDTLGAAVDAWKGSHDSAALARREAEKMDIAAPGRGHSTDVERLQRRLVQQESSMISFLEKIT